MSTDTKVTVAGWVGTQPKHFVSESGTDFTSFRLASTKRYFNRAEDRWVDGPTTWFTVKAWRGLAVNVAESLRKSDPVVVHGTLTCDEWTSPDGPRSTFVIEADALGPDLARGQATFRHTVHTKASGPDGAFEPRARAVGPDGAPAADEPDPWAPSDEQSGTPRTDLAAPDDVAALVGGPDGGRDSEASHDAVPELQPS